MPPPRAGTTPRECRPAPLPGAGGGSAAAARCAPRPMRYRRHRSEASAISHWPGCAARTQANAISQAPERSVCSKDQSTNFPPTSFFLVVCTTSTRSSATPDRASAGAKGCRGGATHAHQRASGRRVAAARAGNRSDSSPAPKQVGRISINPVRSQPPPGNPSSRAANPVGNVRVRAALRPRQMAGCSSRRERSRDMAGAGHYYINPWVFPRRSTPTTMPSMSSGCSLRSTLIGSKSLFSGMSQTTEPS